MTLITPTTRFYSIWKAHTRKGDSAQVITVPPSVGMQFGETCFDCVSVEHDILLRSGCSPKLTSIWKVCTTKPTGGLVFTIPPDIARQCSGIYYQYAIEDNTILLRSGCPPR